MPLHAPQILDDIRGDLATSGENRMCSPDLLLARAHFGKQFTVTDSILSMQKLFMPAERLAWYDIYWSLEYTELDAWQRSDMMGWRSFVFFGIISIMWEKMPAIIRKLPISAGASSLVVVYPEKVVKGINKILLPAEHSGLWPNPMLSRQLMSLVAWQMHVFSTRDC